MTDEIREALSFVGPDDRDTWVRCAMALKSELGDEGFAIWDAWSQSSDRYKPADARSVWRSVKVGGGIRIGTLFALAKQSGWTGAGRAPERRPMPRAVDDDRERLEAQRKAAQKAERMIGAAEIRVHPYLARKGFPEATVLVWDGLLVVPMRDVATNAINSVQTIDADGNKKFLAGGKARGSVYSMGVGQEAYLCEGYATALSVKAALASLYRQARVVVCFSAGNLAHVAQRIGNYVIADHDESKTGERYAIASGLPWWMPPEIGDANDMHQRHGVRALAEAINGLRSSRPRVEAVRGR
jgi:putative DNA primase/helicase